MNNSLFLIIGLFAFLVHSCSDKKVTRPTSSSTKFSTSYAKYNMLPCFGVIEGDYVIKNMDDFKTLAGKMLENSVNGSCDITNLPSIDFSNYNLLGTHKCGSGCETFFDKSLILEAENTLHYSVKVREEGACEPWRCNMNWILIDKLPEKMEVVFN